ncbi:hypothetical protein C3F09_04150 [candidate division GN15 bacterium]|uniref:Secretion system C-terminal sorting domain-containing protein n=1 Tax=candidate division GN15 bacterium TaxID=2072418 RepID=A0A855X2L3_9BACT|nr:MAG: hypothetical protein C3F09_04150 [candidate division GN15 bacterium]
MPELSPATDSRGREIGGEYVKKFLWMTVFAGLALMAGAASVSAQPYPGPRFVSFCDSTSTYNGVPTPVGSILRAYDPQNVLIGVDTFGVNPTAPAGYFGFMPAYGDDPGTVLDEGAITGDTVHFTINGRAATVVTGDPTWADQVQKRVNLAASAVVALSLVTPPNDTLVTINRTITISIGIRNDGTGLDFYRVTATNGDTAFHTSREDSFVYADSGSTVWVTFDIQTPTFVSGFDTVDVVDYTVYSQVDTTKSVSGTVNVILSLTDIPDHGGNLPEGFALYQNYPNPFNPSTVISYSLPSRTNVQLDVIDLLGRTVQSRDLGAQDAGEHQLQFNASGLASGVYFYRIQTDFGVQSRKMMLLK